MRNTQKTAQTAAMLTTLLLAAGAVRAGIEIRTAPEASVMRQLAAKEVARYVYLRMGALPEAIAQQGVVVVATKDAALVAEPSVRAAAKDLRPQQYVLKTAAADGKKTWWIVGGDDLGALYGSYRFAEKLGARFYLHGDVTPDERLASIPDMDEVGKPLFALRGVNPWGSHPFGFDAWGTDDYKGVISQLVKMRMNFIGMHCYPFALPCAEPTVWLGLPGDFDAQGRVKFSCTARYYNTLANNGFGMLPKKTSDYSFGGATLFEDDAWAPEVMRGHCPEPGTVEACNEVFNRMGAQFREAFAFARQFGVKTCIGTEAPLNLDGRLNSRLQAQGMKPGDSATVRRLYEGIFRRIAASHPLDCYWLWTPEPWMGAGNKAEQYSKTVADMRLAIEGLRDSGAPFRLATCGWVLGPQQDRAAFDNDLPKDMPMSALNELGGDRFVDPAYGRIEEREKWAIPWIENDSGNLELIQLRAGRMRRDVADALAYGCTGLIGLHWRTDFVAPTIAALAQAAWDQSGWNPSFAGPPDGATPEVRDGPIGGSRWNWWQAPADIAGTTEAPLYKAVRWGMAGYNIKLPNGRYRVTLKLCEGTAKAAGQRVADFKLQGKTVIQALDVFARVGKFAALDLSFDNIEVADGWLELRVVAKESRFWMGVEQSPCISAIVVEGAAATRKINCGGPAYKDYEADDRVFGAEKGVLPCDDVYADWARANFSAAAGDDIARVLNDRGMPTGLDAGCPSGSLGGKSTTPWEKAAANFALVDKLEALRPRIQGRGNLDRFDWWLNTARYQRCLAHVNCTLGEFNALMKASKPEEALAKYKAMLAVYGEAYRLVLATVNTPGGLACVVNLENCSRFWPLAVEAPARKLEAALGRPLPDDARPPQAYQGRARLIVPMAAHRSVAFQGETLRVKAIALDKEPAKSVSLCWRPLGKGEFQRIAAEHVARGVYGATVPSLAGDFEYYLEGVTANDRKLIWPATAPGQNQTVVVLAAGRR